MAISKKILAIFVLVVTLLVLEKGNISFHFQVLDLLEPHGEPFLPHTRDKRNALSDPGIFSANILLNVSNTETYEQLLSTLNSTSYPLQLDNNTEIQNITVTTVCVSTDTGFQCECEEEFAWPYSTCITYGACDHISNGICRCISGIPADGSSCQLISELLIQTEYEVDLELNLTDIATVDFLRSLLNNNSFFTLDAIVNVTQVNFTTVCSPSSGDYQCRCEDQYRWPCDQCLTYGSCDNITDDTCGCISAIPANGQYCQSLDQHNFTACSSPTITASTPTTPPVIYEHILSVKLETIDATAAQQLRSINYPISINNGLQISEMNISTVCSPNNTTYQCRCEDQYGWPCDMCSTFGKCSDILDNTCGCINALPPNNTYCQPLSDLDSCPTQTPTTEPIVTTPLIITSTNITNTTAVPTVPTTTMSTTTAATTVRTTPPVVRQYLLSFELKTKDVRAVEQLRNFNYTISTNSLIQITGVNISTVCSPNNTTYQCRCEDQYGWPCDMCSTFGKCSDILDNTCGCINALPPNNTYCQPLSDLDACPTQTPTTEPIVTTPLIITSTNITNTTAVPTVPTTTMSTTTAATTVTTTPPVVRQYLLSFELKTKDVRAVEQLRNFNYTISTNSLIQITGVNISTVCSPNNTTYQCRCEDQYGWPCDMCSTFGKCSDILDNTCGCINALPPNNTYCQPLSDLDSCPTQTPTTEPTVTTPLIITSTNITNTTAVPTVPTTTMSTTTAATTDTTNSTLAAPTTMNATTAPEHVTSKDYKVLLECPHSYYQCLHNYYQYIYQTYSSNYYAYNYDYHHYDYHHYDYYNYFNNPC
ncbi:uncharacterized protein PB18E9.04c [Fundulus heteroclitus]|uniref:uncharacterized protein PB18E9.04c n=1 Tax=Fundulus heteroclitus TaxID=8078 RepID=UPI00165A2CC1|nr:uncharacterized protein PB18E9.04c [Fundulus heteroclitus]